MRILDGFTVRQIGDKKIAVGIASEALAHGGMLALNGTGEFLFEKLREDTTQEALTDALCAEYGVEHDRAAADVRAFVSALRDAHLLSEDGK